MIRRLFFLNFAYCLVSVYVAECPNSFSQVSQMSQISFEYCLVNSDLIRRIMIRNLLLILCIYYTYSIFIIFQGSKILWSCTKTSISYRKWKLRKLEFKNCQYQIKHYLHLKYIPFWKLGTEQERSHRVTTLNGSILAEQKQNIIAQDLGTYTTIRIAFNLLNTNSPKDRRFWNISKNV